MFAEEINFYQIKLNKQFLINFCLIKELKKNYNVEKIDQARVRKRANAIKNIYIIIILLAMTFLYD